MGLIFAPVLSILRAIPFWVWLVAAAVTWGGYQRWRANSAAEVYQQAQIEAARKTEAALAENIREIARRLAAQQKATEDAELQTAKARADAGAAADAASRLRQRLDAIRSASASASNPAAAGAGPANGLAEVLGQCADRYKEVAAAADRAVIAGLACEASYNSLTK
jgi:Protein of unknown function (DUF2514)/Tetratricopeptide repeat-like domain